MRGVVTNPPQHALKHGKKDKQNPTKHKIKKSNTKTRTKTHARAQYKLNTKKDTKVNTMQHVNIGKDAENVTEQHINDTILCASPENFILPENVAASNKFLEHLPANSTGHDEDYDNDEESITSENDSFVDSMLLSKEQIIEPQCKENESITLCKRKHNRVKDSKLCKNNSFIDKDDTESKEHAWKHKSIGTSSIKNNEIQNNFSCLFFINEENNHFLRSFTEKSCVEPTIFHMNESEIFKELFTQLREDCPSLMQTPKTLMTLIENEFGNTIYD